MADGSKNPPDGVNREGLDYRAGYIEALSALLQILSINAMRSTKKTEAGIRESFEVAQKLRAGMIDTMKNAGKAASEDKPEAN